METLQNNGIAFFELLPNSHCQSYMFLLDLEVNLSCSERGQLLINGTL